MSAASRVFARAPSTSPPSASSIASLVWRSAAQGLPDRPGREQRGEQDGRGGEQARRRGIAERRAQVERARSRAAPRRARVRPRSPAATRAIAVGPGTNQVQSIADWRPKTIAISPSATSAARSAVQSRLGSGSPSPRRNGRRRGYRAVVRRRATSQASSSSGGERDADDAEVGERLRDEAVGVAGDARVGAVAQACRGEGARAGADGAAVREHAPRLAPVLAARGGGRGEAAGALLGGGGVRLAGQLVDPVLDRPAEAAVAERHRGEGHERHGARHHERGDTQPPADPHCRARSGCGRRSPPVRPAPARRSSGGAAGRTRPPRSP